MKTLAQLKTAVYARGYEDDQGGRIAGFANDVLREVTGDTRWRFMQSTAVIPATAGTGPYALPANVLHVESVRLTLVADYSPELVPVDADTMLELTFAEPTNALAGYTAAWAETDTGVLTVWPAPTGGTFTVRYQRAVAELGADAGASELPDQLFDVVVAGVTQRLAVRERQWEAADRAQAEFDRRLGKTRAQYGLGQRQRAGRVGCSGDKIYDLGL